MLGVKPKSSSSHSAVLLDEERILVIKGDATSDDCFWFLEVRFLDKASLMHMNTLLFVCIWWCLHVLMITD